MSEGAGQSKGGEGTRQVVQGLGGFTLREVAAPGGLRPVYVSQATLAVWRARLRDRVGVTALVQANKAGDSASCEER